MIDDPEVQQAAEIYQLGLPRSPAAGRTGELLGRGTGSSLEFQEYREYLPGDDVRHVDWAAFARSDTLMVRLFRDEISPRTEILLDASRSMNSGGGTKSQVARKLAALVALLVGRLGGRPQILPITDGPVVPYGLDDLTRLRGLPFDGRTSPAEAVLGPNLRLKRQSVRVLISDFLFPHDAAPFVRRLAASASALWLVQILAHSEADPLILGGRRLTDIETGLEAEIVLDRPAIDAYKSRLQSLQDELLRNCRRVHGVFATLVAERGLAALCRNELCAAGVLRVA